MDARAPQRSQQEAGVEAPRRGADHIAPDCAGQNFYTIDRGLRALRARADRVPHRQSSIPQLREQTRQRRLECLLRIRIRQHEQVDIRLGKQLAAPVPAPAEPGLVEGTSGLAAVAIGHAAAGSEARSRFNG